MSVVVVVKDMGAIENGQIVSGKVCDSTVSDVAGGIKLKFDG